jgi:hypothetical protein
VTDIPTATATAPARPFSPSLRRIFSFPVAIGFMSFIAVFILAAPRINEPDIWWHLKNAGQMVQTHSFPSQDQYSFTAAGAAWLDHEWLSEILFFGAYQAMGLRGIVALYLAVLAGIFAGLSHLASQGDVNPKTSSILVLLGVLMGTVSYGPRMLLLGWLCMVVLLVLLQRLSTYQYVPLWSFPLLFCVWINLHGSWLFGLIVLGIYFASGLARGQVGVIRADNFSARQLKRWITVSALSIAALFLNPFGYRLVFYPFDMMLRQQSNIANIDEWQSVDFHQYLGKMMMSILILLILLTLVSRKEWKLHEVALTLFALYASLTYSRMVFFAAIILVPVFAARIQLFTPYRPEKERRWLNAVVMLSVIAVIGMVFPKESDLESRVRRTYPEAALQFMLQHRMTDRVFNEYAWGGYMIWKTPQIKPFIDGRADLFVYNGVFDDYLKIAKIEKTSELLDRYKIRYALLPNDRAITYFLRHSQCWREVYKDDLAAVFEREASTGDVCPAPSP